MVSVVKPEWVTAVHAYWELQNLRCKLRFIFDVEGPGFGLVLESPGLDLGFATLALTTSLWNVYMKTFATRNISYILKARPTNLFWQNPSALAGAAGSQGFKVEAKVQARPRRVT
jgi:hypothetical protein